MVKGITLCDILKNRFFLHFSNHNEILLFRVWDNHDNWLKNKKVIQSQKM